MSKSSLVNVNVPADSSNYTTGRSGNKIEAITIHHMAGVLTAEQCGYIWQNASRNGSSHYGIGNDGRIGQYVDEANTAWCNSNWESNCKSVTIETSNSSTGGNWAVSDQALNSLIKLVADIAKRNNLGTLVKGKNVTWHSMFTATTCPGAYLLSKMDYIIAEANKINSSSQNSTTSSTTTTTTSSLKYSKGDKVVLNGYLYRDSYGNGRGAYKTDYKGVITIVNEKGSKPYHIGSIGWVAESDITKQTSSSVSYYAKYTGSTNSIVDALKSIGVDSSYSNRKKIAEANGITNYTGTSSQNIQMLNLLKQGKLIKA